MRIAFFSPLAPKRTGIATYSQYLSAALNQIAEVDLFDTGLTALTPSAGMRVIDFGKHPECLAKLDGYDGCIYHLGNNPTYHLDIYNVLLRKPGIVVLHDTVLYYLIAGLGIGGLVKEFCINYGSGRLDEVWELVESCQDANLLLYQHPERYPFLKRVFDQATAIIVHSQTAREIIQKAGYGGPIRVIDLLRYDNDQPILNARRDQLKVELGIAEGDLVIGAFGFIGPTKRLPSLIEAIDRVGDRVDCKLLIVGEGEDSELKAALIKRGSDDKVVRTGFVADDDFGRYLAVTDIVVNLRYPSMGETSATLIQAFSRAKPCIVTDHAWFSELPADCVRKVASDKREVTEIEKSLLELAADPVARQELGKRARAYVDSQCSPRKAAADYLEVLRSVAPRKNATPRNGSDYRGRDSGKSPEDIAWVEEYLIERLRDLLPSQQRATRTSL